VFFKPPEGRFFIEAQDLSPCAKTFFPEEHVFREQAVNSGCLLFFPAFIFFSTI